MGFQDLASLPDKLDQLARTSESNMETTRSSDSPVHSAADLDAIYSVRFQNQEAYREKVWSVLARYFSRWIPSDAVAA